MAKVSTNISLDSDLKKESQELLSSLGLDLTTAITIFLKQTIREQGIPFKIGISAPNADTIAAIDEFDEIKTHPEKYKKYDSFEDAMRDVLGDD